MARVYWKGSALLAPVPSVLVTSGTMESANVLTVGWTGVVATHPPKVSVSIRPERHSYEMIRSSGEFVINLVPASLCETADYVGTVTGRCVDKFAKTGLTLLPSKEVAAPSIAECPLSLECRVTDVLPQGSHHLFLADVVSVSVEDSLLDQNGKLHLDRIPLLVFAHGEYFTIGKKLAPIGFSMSRKGTRGTKRTRPFGKKPGEKFSTK